MVEYIKRLVRELQGYDKIPDSHVYYPLLEAVVEEINRLDPRDFLPDAQFYFTFTRASLRGCLARRSLRSDFDEIRGICKAILRSLDMYGGDGSSITNKSFSFITEPRLRIIIERDYRELTLVLFPAGAWKSTVVMAGSILEAILLDTLVVNSAAAIGSILAPTGKKRTNLETWTLQELIAVAGDIGVISSRRLNAIDQSLREYRNYVHPSVEIRTGYPCTEAEALLAKGALDSVLNQLAT